MGQSRQGRNIVAGRSLDSFCHLALRTMPLVTVLNPHVSGARIRRSSTLAPASRILRTPRSRRRRALMQQLRDQQCP